MVHLVFLLWLAAVVSALGPNQSPMETYTVNLNDSPSVRWNHILGNFNSSVPFLVKYYRDEVTTLLSHMAEIFIMSIATRQLVGINMYNGRKLVI